jgi:hypothetical protein
MRGFLTVMLLIYAIMVSLLAYPTVVEIMDQGDDNFKKQLDGASVDSQWEFTKDIASLIQYADELGYKLTFGEAWRHVHMQKYYVAHGLSWTMNSKHRKRKAVDFNLFINDRYVTSKEPYEILGNYWESLNDKNTWGGRWKSTPDAPHFERD